MGRPLTIAGAASTRERLLRSATAAFAADGFARATLADIARAAGISRPSLLHHFPSKEALYDEVVAQVFDALGRDVGEAFAQGGAGWEGRLRGMCDAYGRHLAAHPDHARLVARELVGGEGPGAALIRSRALPLLDTVVSWVTSGPVRPGLPVRHALLWVISDGLLAAAAHRGEGSLGAELWGQPDPDRTWALARTLFLDDPEAP